MTNLRFLFSTLFIFMNLSANNYTAVDELITKQFEAHQFFYCPWRETYSKNSENKDTQQCVFCAQIAAGNDERYFIVRRFNYHVVMLNMFPAVKGHLLIVPYNHVATLSELTPEIRTEFINIIAFSIDILKNTIGFDGVNFGVNMGHASGASIPNHIHAHIAPRKLSDSALTHIIAGVKYIHWDMHELYITLKKAFSQASFI